MSWKTHLKDLNIDRSNYNRTDTLLNHKGCVEVTIDVVLKGIKYEDIKGDACTKESVRNNNEDLYNRALENAFFKAVAIHNNINPKKADGQASVYIKYQGMYDVKNITVKKIKYRYYKNGTRYKRVVRQGKEYDYLFSKETGRIISYARRPEKPEFLYDFEF